MIVSTSEKIVRVKYNSSKANTDMTKMLHKGRSNGQLSAVVN